MDIVEYQFVSNLLTRDYLLDIQIVLRFNLKLDYAYTDLLTYTDLTYYEEFNRKLEERRQAEKENRV